MSEPEKADTQGDGQDSQRSPEDTQAAADVAKVLETGVADSPENQSDSGQTGAEEGAESTPDAPKLTKKQEEAVLVVGLTVEKVLAMGDAGIALANRLVKQRSDLSKHASAAGQLRKDMAALTAEAEKNKAPDVKAEVAEFGEEDDDLGDSTRDKISSNFKAQQAQIDAQREEIAGLKELIASGKGSEEVLDSRGERERDEYFESLGDDWPQFGKGPMSELVDDSPEVLARDELLAEATDKMTKATKQGRSLSLEDACDSALASLYTEEYKHAAVLRARKKAKTKQGGSPRSPTGRQSPDKGKDLTEEARLEIEKELTANPV